jgi:hypothetical protein
MQEVRPARALLSPTWLLALALLLANDHWLKYADLAPGWLTGKLSDLAGMVVAPVLLAVLLVVRRRGALLACHVAVGLVFTAIKLSPTCAGWWSWSMGLLGYPWTIVSDPTDLLALPCLLMSWKLLLPHMDPECSPLVPLQRSAVAGLAALGLWSSVATTEAPVEQPFYNDVFGQLYLNNASDIPIALHVRPIREGVQIDCDEVAEDPGRLLSPEAFGDAQHWLLDPGVNIGLEFTGTDCGALWVAGDGIPPTIFFIPFNFYNVGWLPGFTQNSDDLQELGHGLVIDGGGLATWIGGADGVRFTPISDTPEQPQACVPSANESRIDWSEEIPELASEIVAIDAGLDGCFELTLQEYLLNGDIVVPSEGPYAWYLCVPAVGMPFVAGQFIEFDLMSAASGARQLVLTLLDPVSLLPATGDNAQPLLRVRLLHGGSHPQFIGPAVGRDFEAVDATSCPWLLEPGCATAERSAGMREVGSADAFPIGMPVMFASSLIDRTLVVTYVRERAVVDRECTDGASVLTYDIDLALIEEPG